MQLAADILSEDLARMEKGLSATALRRFIIHAVGIVPALVMPHTVHTVSDATENSLDISKMPTHQED